MLTSEWAGEEYESRYLLEAWAKEYKSVWQKWERCTIFGNVFWFWPLWCFSCCSSSCTVSWDQPELTLVPANPTYPPTRRSFSFTQWVQQFIFPSRIFPRGRFMLILNSRPQLTISLTTQNDKRAHTKNCWRPVFFLHLRSSTNNPLFKNLIFMEIGAFNAIPWKRCVLEKNYV